jgi:hypothetical protein
MTACHVQASGSIELFFYGELPADEREAVQRHLSGCAECRRALEDLAVIRAALEARPVVDAPPAGNWTRFMTRLETAVLADAEAPAAAGPIEAYPRRRRLVAALAAAAVLGLVTMTALLSIRDRRSGPDVAFPGAGPGAVASEPQPRARPAADGPAAADRAQPAGMDPALASVSDRHFKRSKLVVLGLATRDPAGATAADWNYERTLATSLLDDTRLYRRAAEERGMKTIADVMRDLELVLLQTSMSEKPDAESLAQLQRLIRRRDLITKMDVVTTNGLLP